ncbi:layilin [Mytilus galloprovincialis]|uniref:Layilin n=1 Tax=Mytilus galloprovincialis TaxID=29158 RepID=A0A8B6ES94_MYTGA|nr:layilin [Mytilus galloprovincialis]
MKTSNHIYDEPTNERGYTQLASISDNVQKYDDLKQSDSHHSYFEPQPNPQPYVKKDVKVRLDVSNVHDKKVFHKNMDSVHYCYHNRISSWANIHCDSISLQYRKARTFCKKNGSDLVMIGSKEEYNFIISQTTKHQGADFWIGLQKHRNQTYSWIDGSYPTYLAWGIDEPRADNNVCVNSYTMYGNWYGDSCRNQNRVVYEKRLV